MNAPLHRTHNSPFAGRFLPAILIFLVLAGKSHAAWITDAAGARVFVRAIAYAPYHPTELWALSRHTQGTDHHLIRELGANCLITWRPTTYEEMELWYKQGMYTIPQVVYQPPRLSIFADGYEAPVPIYADDVNLRGMREAARDMGSALKGNPGLLAVSMGNDYAWSAYSGGLGFAYGGYDDITLRAFRANLRNRFETVDAFCRRTGQELATFDDALPPPGLSPLPIFWEWWVFMRDTFSAYLQVGKEGLRAVGCEAPTTYCQPYGVRWDPASQGGDLPAMDIVSGNIFYSQSLDWGLFCADINRLISGANGRPVLVTETGAHTLYSERELAPRKIKQSVACVLLHPEVAGVGIYEYCDEWHRSGNPEKQDDTDAREHWGLVTGHRDQKLTFGAAAQMLHFIRRNEQRLQQWQSRPEVLVSQQELDWWRLGGRDGSFYQRVCTELYRRGVSFRTVGNEALLKLDPASCPRLILCDSLLYGTPDGRQGAARSVVEYIEKGGDVLYIARDPWRQLYSQAFVPDDLVPPPDGAPLNCDYGAGHLTLIPTYGLDDRALRSVVEDYLGQELQARPVRALTAPEERPEVFWRVFVDDDGLWMLVVNAEKKRVPRLEVELGEGMEAGRVQVRGADGARMSHEDGRAFLVDLETYALVYLGPEPEPVAPTADPAAEPTTEPVAEPVTEPAAPAEPPQPDGPPAGTVVTPVGEG